MVSATTPGWLATFTTGSSTAHISLLFLIIY
jgi:hypothetical protein